MHCLCCLSLLSLDLGLCHGFLLSLLPCVGLPSRLLRHGGLPFKSGGLLLRSGGLLLRSGGLLLHCGGLLLRSGGLLLRRGLLLRSGGLLLRPGGLWSHPLRPGGSLLCRPCPGLWLCRFQSGFQLCLSFQSLHFHTDLALPLFHLRSTALLDFIKVGASGSRSLGGGYVTNLVYELPLTHHQRWTLAPY